MPMVSESFSNPPRRLNVSRNGNVTNVALPGRATKSQTGYRSGPLAPEQVRALEDTADTWATAVTRMDALDQSYEYTSKASRAFMVNDRDYAETILNHGTFNYRTQFDPAKSDRYYHGVGAIIPQSIAWICPPKPSASAAESMAGGMIRRSVPTSAEINLTRFTGELRQAPMMFKMAAYNPRSLRELGGGFLNMMFGVIPTASDLQTMSELVLTYDSVLREYIRQERYQTRRRKSKVLFEETTTGRLPRLFGVDQQFTAGPVSGKAHHLLPGSDGSISDVLEPQASWSCRARQTINTFGTWEYFIPRPEGVDRRLSRYRQLAQKLVGGGLDAGTIYDLTPWTWLNDWFIDVGGLLRYQQNVVDNQVVASRLGFSIIEEVIWTLHHRQRTYQPKAGIIGVPWTVHFDVVSSCEASARSKRVTRRKGNPYSVSPTWENLSPQQWAITAALGLSRGRGVPTHSE